MHILRAAPASVTSTDSCDATLRAAVRMKLHDPPQLRRCGQRPAPAPLKLRPSPSSPPVDTVSSHLKLREPEPTSSSAQRARAPRMSSTSPPCALPTVHPTSMSSPSAPPGSLLRASSPCVCASFAQHPSLFSRPARPCPFS